MQISLSKLAAVVTGIIVIGMTGYMLYFLYGIFSSGPQPNLAPVVSTANIGAFGPKMQAAAAAIADPTQKVQLTKKDLQFVDTDLFKSFTDLPVVVSTTTKRGREDPFLPYVDTYVAP